MSWHCPKFDQKFDIRGEILFPEVWLHFSLICIDNFPIKIEIKFLVKIVCNGSYFRMGYVSYLVTSKPLMLSPPYTSLKNCTLWESPIRTLLVLWESGLGSPECSFEMNAKPCWPMTRSMSFSLVMHLLSLILLMLMNAWVHWYANEINTYKAFWERKADIQ